MAEINVWHTNNDNVLTIMKIRRKYWFRHIILYLLLVCVTYFLLQTAKWIVRNPISRITKPIEFTELEAEDLRPLTCNIPEIVSKIRRDPAWEASLSSSQTTPDCINDTSMFEMIPGSKLKKLHLENPFWDFADCCYHNFWSLGSKPDFEIVQSSKCYKITKETTPIPNYMNFLRIICKNKQSQQVMFRDQLVNVDEPFDNEKHTLNNAHQKLSILIFGIESLSRQQFHRGLPQTSKYLSKISGAYEFLGFNSIGQGPNQNIYPLLSGLSYKMFYQLCSGEEKQFLDDCPWIWHDLKRQKYKSSFQEEHQGPSLFSLGSDVYRNGFNNSELDFDFRILNYNLSEKQLGRIHENALLHQNVSRNKITRKNTCYGSRLSLKNVVNNFILMAQANKDNNIFHFVWTKTVKNNYEISDVLLKEMLRKLKSTESLNKSILIFISDNGKSVGDSKSGGISDQEYVETRNPLLYIVLPDWFLDKNKNIRRNLIQNTKKIVTTSDLFITLNDLSAIETFNYSALVESRRKRKNQSNNWRFGANTGTINLNIFGPIPNNRTCDSAGVSNLYCACVPRIKLTVMDEDVQAGMTFLLAKLNKDLQKLSNNSCSILKLKTVVSAYSLRKYSSTPVNSVKYFAITFTTGKFGEVLWEGTVIRVRKEFMFQDILRVRVDSNVKLCVLHNEIYPDCVCRQAK